jgi:hypothetical protein
VRAQGRPVWPDTASEICQLKSLQLEN